MQLFTPLEYIKISVATTFGLDKEDWNVRLEWFDEHEHNLFRYISMAEEPAKMFAGINAYHEVLRGNPIGYTVPLDATASGMQILAAMSNCRASAELCNLIDAGRRVDAYTDVYKYMQENRIAPTGLTRAQAKNAVMTSLYASEAEPRKVFGEEYLPFFFQTMNTLAPGAWQLNEMYKSLWDNTVDYYGWVLPDNFHAGFKVKEKVIEEFSLFGVTHELEYKVQQPINKGKALGANLTHSVDGMIDRELNARCNYDPMLMIKIDEILGGEISQANRRNKHNEDMVAVLWKNYELSGFLSARILNYIDVNTIKIVEDSAIEKLRSTMPDRPFEIISVFDCFNVLPTYGNDIRKQYNQVMSEIASSDMLSFMVSQITGTNVEFKKDDLTLADDILLGNYSIS